MDDFLHNLRMSKDRRFDRNRKPYDNQNYKKGRMTDNRRGNYRKPPAGDQLANLLNENLPELKTKLAELVEQQKKIAAAGERRASAEERKASAMEQIADALNHSKKESIPERSEDPAPLSLVESMPAAGQDEDSLSSSDNTTIDLIQAMRARGLSYSKIAEDLNAQNRPTASGRGKWRGPMVSKLCREADESLELS